MHSVPIVTTRSHRGLWENHVEGRPDLSRSFSSRAEAIESGVAQAISLGYEHRIEESAPTGTIIDAAGDRPDAAASPATTDEDGMPVDNPFG